MELLDPILREIIIGSKSARITIRHFTDIHRGAEGHDDKLWRRAVAAQEHDPNSYCIITGDLVDGDRPSMRDRKAVIHAEDDRKEAWTQSDKERMSWLREFIIPDYKRLAPRCLGIIDGDHFMRFSNRMTSGEYICKQTGIPYIGERMGFVVLQIRTTKNHVYSYPIFARHGRAGTASNSASVAAIERQNHSYRAHLYLGGHNHREHLHAVKVCEPNRNGNKIRKYTAWYMRGGSFLDAAYAKTKEYEPLVRGWGEVELTAHRIKNPSGGTKSNSRMLIVEARRASMVAE